MSTSAPFIDQNEELTAQETPPDADERQDEVQTYGEKNHNLPEQLRRALEEAFRSLQQREIFDRRIEVLKDRMHRFYDSGIQHFYPNFATGMFQIGSPGATVNIGNISIECPDYIGDYNIFYPKGRTLDAVLCQNPPGIDFRPVRPNKEEDLEAAQTAEGYRHYFDQSNEIAEIQQKISRMFRLSGRCVAEVETCADAQKWGLNDDGEPRKMETVRIYGTLESKVPILAVSQKASSYCFLYDDPDVLMMKDEYPHIKDQIVGGQGAIGENEWERFARLGVQQSQKNYYLNGNSGKHLVTRIKGYLRPSVWNMDTFKDVYERGEDENPEDNLTADGIPFTVGEKLREIFPEGCRAVFVGRTYAESENCSLDDRITIAFPKEVDGQTGGALMADFVVIQDTFNDYKNAERTYYEKGWPSLWVRAEGAEYDAILDQKSEPAAIRQLKEADPERPMDDNFFQEQPMEVTESFIRAMDTLSGPLGDQIVGSFPALQGFSGSEDKTASGKAMDRSQAMGMLGMPWANIEKLFASIYYQAALLASKNPDHAKEIVVPGSNKGSTMTLRLERITKGKFRAKTDKDSSFPESTTAKRANLDKLVTMAAASPVGALFFQSPKNWEAISQLEGFPELEFIPAEAYRKQTREIELLLQEDPVEPSPEEIQAAQTQHAAMAIIAQQSGLPVPPAPTVDNMTRPSIVPMLEDYHQFEYEACREFLSSEDCWRQEVEGHSAGIKNVRLHAAMHKAFMQQETASQAPPMIAPPKQRSHAGAPEANAQVQKQAATPGAPGSSTI